MNIFHARVVLRETNYYPVNSAEKIIVLSYKIKHNIFTPYLATKVGYAKLISIIQKQTGDIH